MENMVIINKIPKDKDFFPKIDLEKSDSLMISRNKINSNYNLNLQNLKHNHIRNYILNLNEIDFWNLINKRLGLGFPTSANEIERVRNTSDIEYWTIAHLTDELFLQLAKTKEIINYNGKKITIYKYYHQALRMWKWIPISKPKAKFIVNISDLTPRIYYELKSIENHTVQYVLKEAVKRIFENIDFKFYHEHIEDNLEVILKD